MLNPDGKPSVPLPKFSKHLYGTESTDEQGSEGVTLRLGLHQQVMGRRKALGEGLHGMRGDGVGFSPQPDCCEWAAAPWGLVSSPRAIGEGPGALLGCGVMFSGQWGFLQWAQGW